MKPGEPCICGGRVGPDTRKGIRDCAVYIECRCANPRPRYTERLCPTCARSCAPRPPALCPDKFHG